MDQKVPGSTPGGYASECLPKATRVEKPFGSDQLAGMQDEERKAEERNGG